MVRTIWVGQASFAGTWASDQTRCNQPLWLSILLSYNLSSPLLLYTHLPNWRLAFSPLLSSLIHPPTQLATCLLSSPLFSYITSLSSFTHLPPQWWKGNLTRRTSRKCLKLTSTNYHRCLTGTLISKPEYQDGCVWTWLQQHTCRIAPSRAW